MWPGSISNSLHRRENHRLSSFFSPTELRQHRSGPLSTKSRDNSRPSPEDHEAEASDWEELADNTHGQSDLDSSDGEAMADPHKQDARIVSSETLPAASLIRGAVEAVDSMSRSEVNASGLTVETTTSEGLFRQSDMAALPVPEDDPADLGIWHMVTDDEVTIVPWETVARCEAFMMMYERVCPKSVGVVDADA